MDFNPPWHADLREGLIATTGIDIAQHPTSESLEAAIRAKGLPCKPGSARGKLIDGLLGDYLEPTLIQPTFLYDYPRDISPLAKNNPEIRRRWSALKALWADGTVQRFHRAERYARTGTALPGNGPRL
jgi:lysyl-tRNA synthetase class II